MVRPYFCAAWRRVTRARSFENYKEKNEFEPALKYIKKKARLRAARALDGVASIDERAIACSFLPFVRASRSTATARRLFARFLRLSFSRATPDHLCAPNLRHRHVECSRRVRRRRGNDFESEHTASVLETEHGKRADALKTQSKRNQSQSQSESQIKNTFQFRLTLTLAPLAAFFVADAHAPLLPLSPTCAPWRGSSRARTHAQ